MKKLLLLCTSVLFTSSLIFSQTVWNFSNAPFGASGASGGTTVIDLTKNYTTPDGLTVGTDGTVLWTGLSTNSKTIDGVSYTYRLQTGGGGSPAAPSKIPTTRYLSFNVSGPSTINVGCISSSSSASRTLIIVNSNESVIDSIVNISGASAATYSYSYTGSASKLYLYSRSSGLNYYYLSATNVITSVQNIFAENNIAFNGSEITNNKNLELSIFDATGKRILNSTKSISTSNLPQGLYMVRAEGYKDVLKFIK